MLASSVLFGVDWETFVCSGDDVRTCYENLCNGRVYICVCVCVCVACVYFTCIRSSLVLIFLFRFVPRTAV